MDSILKPVVVLRALLILTCLVLLEGCKEAKKKGTESETISWESIKDSYEANGYRFTTTFSDLIGSRYTYVSGEGVYKIKLDSMKMGITDEGQLLPVQLSGKLPGADFEVDINKIEWAKEQSIQLVTSPVGHKTFVGKDSRQVQLKKYEFGIGPEGTIFTAYFEGVEMENGANVSFMFTQEHYTHELASGDCQLTPANFCAPYSGCTLCVADIDAAGKQTGCSCSTGGITSFCLWFTQHCINLNCPTRTCIVKQVPIVGTQYCDC